MEPLRLARMPYDYIIIGGGSAGCVLANRLSEDPGCQVLLLEAGGEADTNLADIPGAASWMQGTRLDWAFTTTPQRELFDRRIPYPRGRVVGGTSILNYLVYIRGNRGDYDTWRQLGNQGWGYDDVLPYFKRAESNAAIQDEYHGLKGPLSVETNPKRHKLCETYIEAAQSIGIPFNPDFNGVVQEGCGYYQATMKNGRRCSTARAYIDPIRSRSNFTLISNAHVTRLIIENGRATGVEYIAGGHGLETVSADAEIICTAGAIGSPHLLMLSGIGPADHLREHGIRVEADLPGVGKDLQDHMGAGSIGFELKDPGAVFGAVPDRFEDAVRQFEATADGLLATHYLDAGAFVSVDPGSEYPALQLFFTPGIAEWYRTDGKPDRHHVYVRCYVCRPKSRGTVTLASANSLDPPVIDPNYLSHPDDLRLTIEGVHKNIEILRAKPFDHVRAGDVIPSGESDDELETFVRRNGTTIWHPTSTCRMGIDDRAVVGPELRVHGVEGLRVCDASVMPTIVSGNTNAPVIMMAEKGADLVRGIATTLAIQD